MKENLGLRLYDAHVTGIIAMHDDAASVQAMSGTPSPKRTKVESMEPSTSSCQQCESVVHYKLFTSGIAKGRPSRAGPYQSSDMPYQRLQLLAYLCML